MSSQHVPHSPPTRILTPAIAGLPIHATFVPFPFVCFTLALATDVAYWQSGELMWQHFSEWLLFVGCVIGGIAAVFGLGELLARRSLRTSGRAWLYALGNLVVLALATWNSLVHARDGWVAVVSTGLILSVATVVAILVTALIGRSVVGHAAGVRHHG